MAELLVYLIVFSIFVSVMILSIDRTYKIKGSIITTIGAMLLFCAACIQIVVVKDPTYSEYWNFVVFLRVLALFLIAHGVVTLRLNYLRRRRRAKRNRSF